MRRTAAFALVVVLWAIGISAASAASFVESLGFRDREGKGKGPNDCPVFEARPYLQNMTVDGVTIGWQSHIPSRARVTISHNSWSTSYTTKSIRRLSHLRVSELDPDTRYYYEVNLLGTDGQSPLSPVAAKGCFRTFPTRERDIRFAILADCGHEPDGKYAGRFAAIMAALSRERDLDFVMFAGDLVRSGWPDEWVPDFLEPGNPVFSRTPFFAVLGNHENNSPFFFDYFDLPMGERYYSFDLPCLHVVGLDSNSAFDEGTEQHNWLIADLESAAKSKIKILVCHHPAFGSGWHSAAYEGNSPKEIPIRTAQELFPKLAKKYGVTAFFCGHEHGYEHNEINGVHYVITGGGGSPGASSEDVEKSVGRYGGTRCGVMHYSLVTIAGGRAHYQAKNIHGAVIDEFGF